MIWTKRYEKKGLSVTSSSQLENETYVVLRLDLAADFVSTVFDQLVVDLSSGVWGAGFEICRPISSHSFLVTHDGIQAVRPRANRVDVKADVKRNELGGFMFAPATSLQPSYHSCSGLGELNPRKILIPDDFV